MCSSKTIQILFPSPLFPTAQSHLFHCRWVSRFNIHHCQRISTSLHLLHPSPQGWLPSHGQGFYYSSHPCQEKLPTLRKTKVLKIFSVTVGPEIMGGDWSSVKSSYWREGWDLWNSCLAEEASSGAGDQVIISCLYSSLSLHSKSLLLFQLTRAKMQKPQLKCLKGLFGKKVNVAEIGPIQT